MLKDIISKLDSLTDEPVKSCGDFLEHALEALEDNCAVEAQRNFQESYNNAVKGKDKSHPILV